MENKYIKSPLNYTGGKHKLLPQIKPIFPGEINTFVDLFTGGANVAVNVDAKRIIANDNNYEIIKIFEYFKKQPLDKLLSDIENIISTYNLTKLNEDGFKELRDCYNHLKVEGEVYKYSLDLLLFVLICYSFNHQFRFNSKGEFNMPFGKNRSQWNSNIEKNLKAFHKSLTEKDILFTNKDFRDLKIGNLKEGDLVYADPPYLITCATYNEQGGWSEKEEKDLLELLDELNERKVWFALSNVLSNKGKTNDILMEWSKKYFVHHLDYTYQNCSYHTKDKESKPDEVLIINYYPWYIPGC